MAYRHHSHNESNSSNGTSDTIYVSQPTSPYPPYEDGFQDHQPYKTYQSPFVAVEDVSLNESTESTKKAESSARWNSQMSEKTRLKSSRLSKTESWAFEIGGLCVAIAAIAAIVGILATYDGRPLSSWPLAITLNAMIALLATAANAGMAVPLSAGISQLKWIRFKTRRTPLSDMEVFDDASRGIWGAVMLLVKLRGGFLGSFGAAVAILTLAFNPFSQQIASFRPQITSSTIGATNLRALSYGLALTSTTAKEGFIPILPFKAAVYNGLFAENGKPLLSLPFTCETGDCSWNVFETLGVCNHCVDMSEYMTRYCANATAEGDMTKCGWSVPSGAKLNSHAEVFSMTPLFSQGLGDMPYSTIMKLVFMGTEAQDDQLKGRLSPWARQCTVDVCVQTLQSSVQNGELNETIVRTTVNASVPTSTTQELEPIFIQDSKGNETYQLSMQVMMGMRSWFADLFKTGSASRNAEFINNTITTSDNVVVNLTVGISSGETFFDTDIVQAFYWNYYEYPLGIDMLMNDLATSVTVNFRAINKTPVEGLANTIESYVFVRWGFITVPVLAVLLTAIFLGAAIHQSQKHNTSLWKNSVLATLIHGLDVNARDRLEDVGDLREQLKIAKGVRVRLDDGDAGTGLLTMSLYDDI